METFKESISKNENTRKAFSNDPSTINNIFSLSGSSRYSVTPVSSKMKTVASAKALGSKTYQEILDGLTEDQKKRAELNTQLLHL